MTTHREKEGLLGPVHTVRVHVTKLPATIERPDTSGRTLEEMITYDPEGRKTEDTIYGDDEVIHSRKVYVRDESQHTGWMRFDSGGSLVERCVCAHDPDGERTEHLTYGSDGKLQQRQVTSHDKENKQPEKTFYMADGTLMWKWVTIYDDQERMIEHRSYVPNQPIEQQGGKQEHRTVFTYRDSENTFEVAWYSGDTLGGRTVFVENTERHTNEVTCHRALGELKSRETIEQLKFDDHGNWTEQRVSTWVAGASKTEPTEVEPTELHHRIITYH